MTIPTSKVVEQLCQKFQRFSKENSHTRGIDRAFRYAISHSPTLVSAFDHLTAAIPNAEFRRRVLRGHNPLHYTCALCGRAMCGTKDICSNSCVRNAIHSLVNRSTWVLVSYRMRKYGNITGASFKCSVCGTKVTKDLCYIRGGYGCLCQRGDRISKISSSKVSPSQFRADVADREIPIELLSDYYNTKTLIRYRCLDCGDLGLAKPKLIMLGRFCLICNARKAKEEYLAKYGVEYSTQREDLKSKRQATMVSRYGVPFALQNPKILAKMQSSSYSRKVIKLGRRTVGVQGYEPQAITWLLSNAPLQPRHIRCGNDSDIPTVPYSWQGKTRIYHPDIYVPKHNLLIEVKSDYSLARNRMVTKVKLRAARRAGYNVMLLVMSASGERLNGK